MSGKWTSIQGTRRLTVAGTSLNGQFVIAAERLPARASRPATSGCRWATYANRERRPRNRGRSAAQEQSPTWPRPARDPQPPGPQPGDLTNLAVEVNTESTAVVDPTTGSPLPAGPYVQVAATIPTDARSSSPARPSVRSRGTCSYSSRRQAERRPRSSPEWRLDLDRLGHDGVGVQRSGRARRQPRRACRLRLGDGRGEWGGASGSGDVLLQINTTGAAVNATVTVAGQSITINYGASQGNLFALSISNLALSIGNVVTVEGTITHLDVHRPDEQHHRSGLRRDRVDTVLRRRTGVLANGSPESARGRRRDHERDAGVVHRRQRQLRGERHRHGGARRHGSVSASGQGTILVNTFQDQFNDTIAIPGSSQSVPLVLGASQATSATAPFFSVSGSASTSTSSVRR